MYLYDEREEKIKEFSVEKDDNKAKIETYNGQLLFMSNVYALLKSSEIEYSFLDKKWITSKFININFVENITREIDSGMLNEKSISILKILRQIVENFIKNNY